MSKKPGHIKTTTEDWAERWLSSACLDPYLAACDDDIDTALSLYEWNVGLSQVLTGDIAHLEVSLRNAYDRTMCNQWGEGWLIDNASPARQPVMRASARGSLDANRINRKSIDAAMMNLPEHYTHGDLVASLTLGFWVHLADRSRETIIWRTGLYRAWPKGTQRQVVQRSLYAILKLRNRVAHQERLFNPTSGDLLPTVVDHDIVRLFRMLCPEAADYVYGCASTTPIEEYFDKSKPPAPIRL